MEKLTIKPVANMVPKPAGTPGRGRKTGYIPYPTVAELNHAHELFEKVEPRELFYRVAMEIVETALNKRTSLSIADGLAVLLQTWNKEFYRFRGGFKPEDLRALDYLVTSQQEIWTTVRMCSLEHSEIDQDALRRLFAAFRESLGPVGIAKSLHLLAPRYFPLWDTTIAGRKHYNLALDLEGYVAFMRITKEQCKNFGGEAALGRNPLKAIDEYNYCRAKGWNL